MSSENAQSSKVTSIAYSFVLKWTLKAKQLNDLEKSSNYYAVLSDIFKYKLLDNCQFYLEVEYDSWDDIVFPIHIKGSELWSFKLASAYLVSEERAFKLSELPQLSFLNEYNASVSDEENVTIHCVVNARPVHRVLSAKENVRSVKGDELSVKEKQNAVAFKNVLVKEDELTVKEAQNTVEFENVSNITFPINYENETVIDFILYGDVPNLTIDQAIQIISEIKEHKCEALKILCMEYLMANISKESIRKISEAALDYDLLPLQRSCLQLIADGQF